MKLTSPRTYRVVRYLLDHSTFKQVEVEKGTGVSFALVNRVVNGLIDRKYVAKQPGGYRVIAPAALAQQFSFFRRMEKLQRASIDIDASPAQIKEMQIQTNSRLCLASALRNYDDYFHDPAIQLYATKEAIVEFMKFPSGRTRIEFYEDDLMQEDDFNGKEVKYTTETRTIIDLMCSQRAYAVDKLIQRKWV